MRNIMRCSALFLFLIAGQAQAQSHSQTQTPGADDVQPFQEAARFRLEETGEKRMCLQYTKIDGLMPVREDTILFVYGDKHYLNTTQSGCFKNPNIEVTFRFQLRSGNVCRNTLVRLNNKTYPNWTPYNCTLSDFREVALIPIE